MTESPAASPMTDKDVQTLMNGVEEIRKLLGQLTKALPKRSRTAQNLASEILRKTDPMHELLSARLEESQPPADGPVVREPRGEAPGRSVSSPA